MCFFLKKARQAVDPGERDPSGRPLLPQPRPVQPGQLQQGGQAGQEPFHVHRYAHG